MDLTSRRFGMVPLFLLAVSFSLMAPLFWTHVEAPREATVYENQVVYGRILPSIIYGYTRLRGGDLPLWSPQQYCGVPYFCNPIHGLLQPLNLIFLAMPPVTGLALHAFAGLFLMALFLAILLRTMGANCIPAAIGGMVYAFGGAAASVMSSPELLGILIWPPLLYTVAYAHSEYPRSLLVLLGGLIIAAILLSGSPVFGALLTAGALLFGIARSLARRRIKGVGLLTPLKGLAIMALIGMTLSAVQWVPFVAWLGTLAAPSEAIWPNSWSGHLPSQLAEVPAALLLPRGSVLPGMLYFGAIPLMLVPAALLHRQRRVEVLYFLVASLCWIGLAVWGSDATAATDAWKALVFPGAFGVAVLAGLGADRLLLTGRDPRSPLIWGSVLLVLVGAGFLLYAGTADTRGRAALAVMVLLPFFIFRLRWIGALCGACLAFLLFVDLRDASNNVYQHPYTGDAHWLSDSLPAIKEAEAQALGDRIFTLPASRETVLPANIGMMHAVENAGGGYWPLTRDQAVWWSHITPYLKSTAPVAAPDENGGPAPFYPQLFNYMGVRVIVGEGKLAWMDDETTRDRLRLRFYDSFGRLSLWKNESALARVRWTPQWQPAADTEEAVTQLLDPAFSARTVSVVRAQGRAYEALKAVLPPGISPDDGTVVAEARCTLVREAPESLEISTDTTRPGILVLADSYDPGWRAYIDGKQVSILQVNALFRGVLVPEGKHSVVFSYAPLSITIGLLLTGFGALACAGWGVFALSRYVYGLFRNQSKGPTPEVRPEHPPVQEFRK